MMNFKLVAFVTIVTFVVSNVNCDYTETIVYDDLSCLTTDNNERFIYDNDVYYVKWYGNANPGCKLTFVPSDTNGHVCIKAKNFDVTDCSVEVRYYIGYTGDSLTQVYSCFDDDVDTYCSDGYQDVAIQVKTRGDLNNPGSFDLKVYTRGDTKVGLVIGLSVGVPVVAIAVIVIFTVMCCVRRRRNKRRGMMVSRQPGYPPYAGYQSINGQNQQGVINSNYVVNSSTTNSTCPHCHSQLPPYEESQASSTTSNNTTASSAQPKNRV